MFLCFHDSIYNTFSAWTTSGKQIVWDLLSLCQVITYNCLYYFFQVFFMDTYKLCFRFMGICRKFGHYYKFIMILYQLLWNSYSFITLLI
jgi:hypothetical protein